jgi:hypothetical protein
VRHSRGRSEVSSLDVCEWSKDVDMKISCLRECVSVCVGNRRRVNSLCECAFICIPEELNRQLHCCDSVKPGKMLEHKYIWYSSL